MYQCALCKGVFGETVSDEEVMEETRALFGYATTREECDVICDDCFKTLPVAKTYAKEEQRPKSSAKPQTQEEWRAFVQRTLAIIFARGGA